MSPSPASTDPVVGRIVSVTYKTEHPSWSMMDSVSAQVTITNHSPVEAEVEAWSITVNNQFGDTMAIVTGDGVTLAPGASVTGSGQAPVPLTMKGTPAPVKSVTVSWKLSNGTSEDSGMGTP